jgi:outer membrane immunogenic protein
VSDIDTAVVDSLKVLDPKRPIREADIDWLRYNVSAPEQTPAGVILTGGDVIGSKKMDWLSTIRGRLGYAGYDRALFYVTGGVALSNLKYQVVDACNTGACGGGLTSGSTNQTVGWTLGGGVEYAFSTAWSAKAEYLYVDFAGKSFTTSASTSVAITPWSADDTRMHLVRVGLNYRFGGM